MHPHLHHVLSHLIYLFSLLHFLRHFSTLTAPSLCSSPILYYSSLSSLLPMCSSLSSPLYPSPLLSLSSLLLALSSYPSIPLSSLFLSSYLFSTYLFSCSLTSIAKSEATIVSATDAIMYPPLAATSSTHTIKPARTRGE